MWNIMILLIYNSIKILIGNKNAAIWDHEYCYAVFIVAQQFIISYRYERTIQQTVLLGALITVKIKQQKMCTAK